MKNIAKIFVLIMILFFLTGSCTELLSTYVRFRNNSLTKTVNAIWDGVNTATLSMGETSEYIEVNPGNHTIQWKNANTGKTLTSLGYPSLVKGKNYTYPYND